MLEKLTNWSGNYVFGAPRVHYPESVDEVRGLVAGCTKARTLGSRHSFNGIADCAEDLISLERLDRIVALNRERRQVTIEGGVRYGALCRYLNDEGFALHNLASLPHISVAGACATATHGSGDGNGCLATAVAALEIVKADGELAHPTREENPEHFAGAVVALGGLGAVTKLTLDVSPAFTMRQDVYEGLSIAKIEDHFDNVMSNGYSVSLFTDWQSATFSQVWVKRRIVDGDEFQPAADLFGAPAAPEHRHPIGGISAENCTDQMGIAGSWHERMPHFRMDFTPSCGEELQSEYLVPRRHAWSAIRAVERLSDRIAPLLQISEIRTIAADGFWMSPFYNQACVSIHFTWRKDWAAVRILLPEIEAALATFEARPHWGKLFTMAPEHVQSLYARLPDFRRLLLRYDPEGKFRNGFLDAYVGSGR